ncbi:MAG: CHAP domain-containing protein [Pirellulales bacterium]
MKTIALKRTVVCGGIVLAILLCRVHTASAGDLPADLGAAMVSWSAQMAATFKTQEEVSIVTGKKILTGLSIGDGQCTRLAEAALGVVGAKPGKGYVWGRPLNAGEAMRLGDIIQFKSFVIKDGGATWYLGMPNHTAIVAGVNGSKVSVFHQNTNGEPAVIKSRIVSQQFDLSKRDSGSYIVYRPQK